ncbi:hypothetical protein KCU65_g4650, partial [Aureobasidium melanogenum]
MKLVDKKIRKNPPHSVLSGSGVSKSSVKKTPPVSPKSATRTSLRQQHKDPESGPLPDSWENFDTKKEIESAEFISKIIPLYTPEGVAGKKRWKYKAGTEERELWGFYADRKIHHFYPGQIIRVVDTHPQSDLNIALDDQNTETHKDGPVTAKKRPMVVLWKTHSAVLCLPMRTLGESKAMETHPDRWYEYISATSEDDASWEGQTTHAGPPLIFIPNPNKDKDDVIKGRCYISLVAPTLVNIGSDIRMDLGRLGGSAYCRLIEAYTYSQNQNKQKAFEEFGEVAELPDPDTCWAGKDSGPWKLRETRMNKKVPVVVDKTTTVYKLE